MLESVIFVAACIAAVVLLGIGVNSLLKKIEEVDKENNMYQ